MNPIPEWNFLQDKRASCISGGPGPERLWLKFSIALQQWTPLPMCDRRSILFYSPEIEKKKRNLYIYISCSQNALKNWQCINKIQCDLKTHWTNLA